MHSSDSIKTKSLHYIARHVAKAYKYLLRITAQSLHDRAPHIAQAYQNLLRKKSKTAKNKLAMLESLIKSPEGDIDFAKLDAVEKRLADIRAQYQEKTHINHALFHLLSDPVDSIKLLILAGANVNAKDIFNDTPLIHLAARNIPDSLEKIKILIAAGADPNIAKRRGDTPLIHVAINSNPHALKKMKTLIAVGADVNIPGAHGNTALTHVVARNLPDSLERIKILIAAGAQANLIYLTSNLTPALLFRLILAGAHSPSGITTFSSDQKNAIYIASHIKERKVRQAISNAYLKSDDSRKTMLPFAVTNNSSFLSELSAMIFPSTEWISDNLHKIKQFLPS